MAIMILLPLIFYTGIAQNSGSDIQWSRDPYFADRYFAASTINKVKILETLAACGETCASNSWCTSFFYNEASGKCSMLEVILTNRDKLTEERGSKFYRVYDSSCPVQDCYFKDRVTKMCLALYLVPRDYTGSKKLCAENGGRLPSVKTQEKNVQLFQILMWNTGTALNDSLHYGPYLGGIGLNESTFSWENGSLLSGDSGLWKQPGSLTNKCVTFVFNSSRYWWLSRNCTDVVPMVLCERI